MLSVIQVVTHGSVSVEGAVIGSINKGIVALIGIEKSDTQLNVEQLFTKIMNFRIFPDAQDKTNLSLKDVEGGLLLVPQFTLVAETSKGTRPGFSIGMPPQEGRVLFDYFVTYAKGNYGRVESGSFGAYMQVSLCNDGPSTFILKV